MRYSTVLFLFLLATSVHAQNGGGVFSFARVPVSNISGALGGAQVSAFRGDVAQVANNPAFIDSAMHGSVTLAYLNYLTTINQASIAGARMFDSLGFGSVYLRYFDYGSFDEIDENGIDAGSFRAVDYEIGVNFARQYKDGLTYGASLKQLFSNMYSYFAYGIAIDLGAYYTDKSGNFNAGLTLDDLGMKLIDYTATSNEWFPWSLNIAVAKKFDKAPLMFALQYSNLQKWDLAGTDADALNSPKVNQLTGEAVRPVVTFDNLARHLIASAAFVPSEQFELLLGYNFRRRLELATAERPALVGFSLGTRIHVKKFTLMYSVSSYHLSGTSNQFALATNINEWYQKKSMP